MAIKISAELMIMRLMLPVNAEEPYNRDVKKIIESMVEKKIKEENFIAHDHYVVPLMETARFISINKGNFCNLMGFSDNATIELACIKIPKIYMKKVGLEESWNRLRR